MNPQISIGCYPEVEVNDAFLLLQTSPGGVGSANFEVSVEGSKAKGVFYSSFYKRLSKWRYESGTLLLNDGRNITVPPP